MSKFDDFPHDEDDEIEYVSKTQLKQEMAALQELGSKIVDLSEKLLHQIPLEGRLEEAILECRRIKSREGRRRQLQFIGKLMRQTDYEAIQQAYEKIEARGRDNVQRTHQVERWRDRLIDGGSEAMGEFLQECWNADRQHLRQLIRAAQKERSQEKPPASARKLFRYIRELMDEL